ncbi:hypothetical protein APR41_06135 [Salegentibacter salinarum]|uniref:DUF2938 domain-containing protein n=1 Tax=Salegentibacter salinarum TaxID=447422 RepID=A0A2N0TQJ8_9FLAO|nr:hypothetical protein [Salegentibacter salinarum]PKD17013.1 hypothetical protein APR41_06135 [Salegentibacter salinarum]SKB53728.1 hypothetical protein SAMN05660903_01250 [Salegentibacter salinarum]
MEVFIILISGLVATTSMTLFSYLVSNFKSKQFREPELLNSLISRSEIIELRPSKNHFLGWVIHYLIGWFFVVVFSLIWEYTQFSTNIISGAVLGLAAGIIGIFGWKTMFKLNQNPPEIDFSQFYIQLIIAHILFGLSAAIVYAYL